MNNQWQAQYIVDEQKAFSMIKKQFPQLDVASIQLLGAGWDNTAYIINNEFVFRFPRRDIAVSLLQHEMAALPVITKQVSIAVPNPEWHGKPTQEYPWPFAGYRMLRGITADRLNLSDEQRTQLAKPIAHFLSQLHAIAPENFPTLPRNVVLDRLGLHYLIPTVTKNLEKLESIGLLEYKKQLYHILNTAPSLRSPTNNTLVHGDLYCRHLLVNDQTLLTGIIDWGDVQMGDPALDLVVAHSFLPPSAHAIFKASYGTISDSTWHLARFRALHHSLLLILYGHDTGDAILVREAKRSLIYIAKN